MCQLLTCKCEENSRNVKPSEQYLAHGKATGVLSLNKGLQLCLVLRVWAPAIPSQGAQGRGPGDAEEGLPCASLPPRSRHFPDLVMLSPAG